MFREPDILRDTSTDHPSYLDGPGLSAPIGTGVEELVHSYQEPGTRPLTEIL